MATYNIETINEIINGQLLKQSGGTINYLLIDSRKILFPRESLFFALRGSSNDGHFFIGDLYKSGVRNFIVEELPADIEKYNRGNFVKVTNTFYALQKLVQHHRHKINTQVVGITGSNGKTIIKEWLYQCLAPGKYVVRNPKSYNSQIGVPLSVWLLNQNADYGIFEAGISKPGEMENLQRVIDPTIGIFTNIGDAHQENFTSVEQKIDEKIILFNNCKSIIYNADNLLISQKIESKFAKTTQLFNYSFEHAANLQIIDTKHYNGHTYLTALVNNNQYKCTIPFTDKASIENAVCVWCFLLLQQYPHSYIESKLNNLEPVAMRLEIKEGTNNCTIINDSYNSDLESLHIALDFLNQQNQHPQKMLILSDIEQSGHTATELYAKVAGMVKQKQVDKFIGIGPNIMANGHFFDIRKELYHTTDEFLQQFTFHKLNNTAILLKGARKFTFENISKALQKQTHRTVFEIDLNAVEHNLNYFKKLLKPTTGIIAMLKASGYGSGTYEMANLCQYKRVSIIAVAFADEGVELRKGGIRLPIMVMNPELENYQLMIDYALEPQIYNFSSLKAFNQTAGCNDTKPFPVHIKIDTGMNRSGFLTSEVDQLIDILLQLDNIKVSTVFSHLATADEPQQDEFTLFQISEFEKCCQQISNALPYKFKRHILNSAGIERFTKYQYDMVRLGIGFYGISAVNAPLCQVGTLKTSIAQVKNVKAGSTIGYSRKGIANTDITIATIPIGYADGLRRSLSNGVGKVFIKGKLAPIIGNICMDICMIDVTGINVDEGDTVEIFGKNLNVNTVAKLMGTIPYEVLTGISKRVKRTYVME